MRFSTSVISSIEKISKKKMGKLEKKKIRRMLSDFDREEARSKKEKPLSKSFLKKLNET